MFHQVVHCRTDKGLHNAVAMVTCRMASNCDARRRRWMIKSILMTRDACGASGDVWHWGCTSVLIFTYGEAIEAGICTLRWGIVPEPNLAPGRALAAARSAQLSEHCRRRLSAIGRQPAAAEGPRRPLAPSRLGGVSAPAKRQEPVGNATAERGATTR